MKFAELRVDVDLDPHSELDRKRVHRRWSAVIPLALAIGIVPAAESAAQQASIQWRVTFNGVPGGGLTTVLDNAPGDEDLDPTNVQTTINVSSGSMTLTGTLIGEFFRTAANNPGRRFLFTGATASVAPGQLQNPPGTIELFACYDFALTPVGPPHTFGSRIAGFYDNIAGGGNDIDLAKVDYQSDDDLCSFAVPAPVAQPMAPAFDVAPTVPFNDFQGGGPYPFATQRIGSYHMFLIQNDGDAVVLPNSTEASAIDVQSVPGLTEVGRVALIVGMLSLGALAVVRWSCLRRC